jgi:hypothetical protein
MRIMAIAFGTALALCNLETFSAAAHARKAKLVREPRPIIRVPMVRADRPDSLVVRYGDQLVYLPPWTWPEIFIPPLISP